ncbi:MAG: EamA family transporter [Gemmatimonadota bacterium]
MNSQATVARPRVVWAEIAVIGMALIWGVNYSVIKYGTGVVPPLAYNSVRVLLGATCLLAIALVWGGKAPSRRDALTIIALGALGNGVYQIFFAEGISRTRAGEAALVVGASPALMAIIGGMRGVERVTTRGLIGIALSIFGVGLVVLGRAAAGGGAPGGSLIGDLLVLAGSVCWAVYTILLIPYTKRLSGWYVLAYSMIGGSIVLGIVGARSIASVNWLQLSATTWAAVFYSGLGALVLAYILWYRGVKVLGPTRTALYGNIQPLIALLVAWVTLHEVPTAWQVVGALTIVGGVLLTRAPATEQS